MPTTVLFVCLGNICRSPMAEAVFHAIVRKHGLESEFEIDSAGTAGYHIGAEPDRRSVACCKAHDVPVDHRARQVNKLDFDRYDHILCMDESNLADLLELGRRLKRKYKANVMMLGEFDPRGERIIKDPYYGGMDGFEVEPGAIV